jgi:hypothetical protein
LDGDHYKSTTFSTFTTTFVTTTTNIRRIIGYWIIDGGSGTTTLFLNV